MARVNVRVDNAAIQGMFESYGEIGRFGQRTTTTAVGLARLKVGKRTGRLAASIRGNPAAGALRYTISLGSPLDYAGWVEDGTDTPILPTSGRWLAVGKREGKKPVYRHWVHGQKAQKYLAGGAEQALAREGIMIRFP